MGLSYSAHVRVSCLESLTQTYLALKDNLKSEIVRLYLWKNKNTAPSAKDLLLRAANATIAQLWKSNTSLTTTPIPLNTQNMRLHDHGQDFLTITSY